jgi:hypothetical protein
MNLRAAANRLEELALGYRDATDTAARPTISGPPGASRSLPTTG